MWKKLKAFVLVTLGKSAFAEGKLNLSDEDQQKLDAAAKQEGFAAKFMAKYNDELEAENASAEIEAFMKEQGIGTSASSQQDQGGEGDDAGELNTEDEATLSARVNALMGEVTKLKAVNKQQEGNIAALEKLPDADEAPETVKANLNQLNVKHSKTHLFATANSYDAFVGRPWNEAAKQAMSGAPITAATNWTETANIDKLNSDIQDYFRKHSDEIHDLMLDGYELPKYVEMISGVSDEYTHNQIITGEITQSLKSKFLPKNKVKFEAEKGKVRDIQIDMLFEGYELKKLEKSYLKRFSQLGITDSNPHKERFVMYVVKHIMRRARKEDKIVTGRGVYFADPNRETPASFINNFDGFLKLYLDARGVKYRPFDLSNKFVNGKPTKLNIYNYVNEMVDRLPYEFRIQPDLIFKMSPYWLGMYHDDRERIKGGNTDYTGKSTYVDNYSNIELVPYDQMEGEDFMYIIPKGIEFMLTDKPGEDGFIQFQKGGDNPRNMKAFGDYKLSAFVAAFGRKEYGKNALDYDNQLVFSNDVEVLTTSYVPVSANNATPSLEHHHSLIIGDNNTAATNITNLTNATVGKRVYMLGNGTDYLSTVKNNTNIILADGDFVLEKGNLLVLQALEGGKFIEISRKEGGAIDVPDPVTLAPNTTTADAELGTEFITSENTQATALTTIENAIAGERYTITGGGGTPNATTIANAGNFFLTGAITLTDGVFITVEYNGSKFVEIARG